MNKIIGYFLLTLPYTSLAVYIVLEDGFSMFVKVYGIVSLIIGMIILGVYFITKDEK